VAEKPPKPLVKSILNIHLPPKIRVGRGFSIRELKEAGLTIKEARKLGIRIDPNRKSMHEWNIEELKKYINKLQKK